MKQEKKLFPKEDLVKLKKILKNYRNLYKVLYLVNPSIGEDFLKKQELFYKKKQWSEEHFKLHPKCEKSFKQNTKFYIPKDQMNTYEKQLYEIYDSFFTQSNLNDLLLFLEDKFSKILKKGESQGLSLKEEEEKDIVHKILLEGIPFYMSNLLKNKLKEYENSISEQPALIANPMSVTDKKMLNFLSGDNVKSLVNGLYTVINKNIYENIDIEPYEMYNQFKFLYDEGLFEQKFNDDCRTDFMFNFHVNYFKDSKYKLICSLAEAVYSMPYELNMKYQNFQLQVNDYMQASFFRPNYSEIKKIKESSMKYDTGKKLTYLIVLFPNEVSLSDRYVEINLYEQDEKNDDKVIDKIKLDKPLSGIIFKTRRVCYEVLKRNIPFAMISFYMHGPKDPDNNF